jgi:hypothetical protein
MTTHTWAINAYLQSSVRILDALYRVIPRNLAERIDTDDDTMYEIVDFCCEYMTPMLWREYETYRALVALAYN